MKKYSIIFLLVLFFVQGNATTQTPSVEIKEESAQEKTYAIRKEINTFITRPDIQERLNIKSKFVRSMLNKIDRAMLFAENPSAFGQAMNHLFDLYYNYSINNTLLLKKDDAPLLHKRVLEICNTLKQPMPLIFLDKDCFNASALSFRKGHACMTLGGKLIEKMSDQGLNAIIAHEICHINHHHSILTISAPVGLFLTAQICNLIIHHKLPNFFPAINTSTMLYYVILACAALVIGRTLENDADNTAIITAGAENFVIGMEEMSAELRKDFKTHEEEYATVQKKLTELKAKSPKIAKWLGFNTWLKKKIRDFSLKSNLDGINPFDEHPSFRQRIEKGKRSMNEQATNNPMPISPIAA